jgi:hypothetical protein
LKRAACTQQKTACTQQRTAVRLLEAMLTRWLRTLDFDTSDHAAEDRNAIAALSCDQHTSMRVVEILKDRLLELTVSKREQQQDEGKTEADDDPSHGKVDPVIDSGGAEEKDGDLRIISLEEVGQHADQDDAWMVIYDKVCST